MSEEGYRELEVDVDVIQKGDEYIPTFIDAYLTAVGELLWGDTVKLPHTFRRPIAPASEETIVGPQRNMTPEERQALDKFTWSELENGGEVVDIDKAAPRQRVQAMLRLHCLWKEQP